MTRQRRPQIGILGGTFNPIHLGHLLMAQDALEQARLDRVVFIPSATPPHKRLDGNVPAQHRLAMVKLAIRGDKRFAVSDLEILRGGKSYSVDTVLELQRRQPRAEFHFIIGADSLEELHLWKDAPRLVKLCQFIAVTRPGFSARPNRRLRRPRYRVVQAHPCDIASRDIRARVARGQSIRYLVPEAVRLYVERHQLYR